MRQVVKRLEQTTKMTHNDFGTGLGIVIMNKGEGNERRSMLKLQGLSRG